MTKNTLPSLTDEQRRASLRKAVEARRENVRLKEGVRNGEIAFSSALEDPRFRRMKVKQLLVAVPTIGNAIATDIMKDVKISEIRRVGGLGCRQKEKLLNALRERTRVPLDLLGL